MKNKFFFLPVVLLLPLLLTNCVGINEEFAELRNKIVPQFGDDYKAEFQFSIGSVGITVSSWIVDFAEDEDFVDDMMREISSVQVGVYKKLKDSDTPGFSVLNDIENNMMNSGWKSIVRSSENNEVSAVYIRTNREEFLKRLFVISSNEEELVLVEVKGDLKEIITTMIEEKGMKLKM
jgi:hypothetical protein